MGSTAENKLSIHGLLIANGPSASLRWISELQYKYEYVGDTLLQNTRADTLQMRSNKPNTGESEAVLGTIRRPLEILSNPTKSTNKVNNLSKCRLH